LDQCHREHNYVEAKRAQEGIRQLSLNEQTKQIDRMQLKQQQELLQVELI
jgi:hypothetical protein